MLAMKRVAIALGLLTGIMVLTGGIAIAVAPRDSKSAAAKPKPAPVKLDDLRTKDTVAASQSKQADAPVEPVDPFAKHASPIPTSSTAMERLSVMASAQAPTGGAQAPMGEPTPADDPKTATADAQADDASTVTSADDIPNADAKTATAASTKATTPTPATAS